MKMSVGSPEKQKILVVDDEETICRMMTRALVHAGYDVYCVLDGYKALELFEEHNGEFDLLILDYALPGINGYEVLARVRSLRKDARAILSSGYAAGETGYVRNGETHQFNGFLPKPYHMHELVKMVEQHLYDCKGEATSLGAGNGA
jgi:CheY-like chemotaxis protein